VTRRLGVDVGGTKCLGVLVDADGRVIRDVRVRTPPDVTGLIDTIAEVVERLGGGDSLGVGLPGLVDAGGVLRAAPNLAGVAEFPARALLEQRLGMAVAVDNDATCATLAEWSLGAGRGVDDLVLVTLGTGIGGGLVAGGRVRRGAHGMAGEIGHMVVEREGRPCRCGHRGCWERYASGSALGDHSRALTGAHRPGEEVIAAARRLDAWALEVVEVFVGWVALGLANLANVLDPARFVIGGGLADSGDVVLAGIRDAYARALYSAEHRPLAEIVMASLGPEAGAVGAALLGAEVS